MAAPRSNTIWIVVAAVAGVVFLGSVAVVITSLDDEGTVVPTTTTTTTTVPGASTTEAPESTTTTEPPRVDEQNTTMQVGLAERSYLTVAPKDIGSDERLPAVIVLHGLGANHRMMSNAADWRGAVEEKRFLAVFPQGVADSWNMGPCCPPANLLGVDDVGFLDRVAREVLDRDDVDPDRLFLTGFSNGGVMTYALACARPDLFAAIAPMAGSNLTGCAPPSPIPLLHQHSDPDFIVPYDGQPAIGQLVSSADFPPVPDSVGAWAVANGCAAEPTSTSDDDVERIDWTGCPDDGEVHLVRIPGPGHVWPNKGRYDPLETMLDFFGID